MSEEQDKQGDQFQVKDRRRFNDRGEAKADAPEQGAAHEPIVGGDDLPEMDFSTFVLSLSSSAMMHMGETELPGGGTVKTDLALAKQSIDILEILQEKTKGNLSEDEAGILQELLYTLRVTYVNATG
jgi:hypothetical protein